MVFVPFSVVSTYVLKSGEILRLLYKYIFMG